MSEGFFLKTKDQLKAEVVYKINSRQMTRKDGLKILGVSERTLERYLRSYGKLGIAFVSHGNKGKAPVNRTSGKIKKQVMELVKEKYFDFNMTHCLEKIRDELGIEIKRETFS